MVNIHEYLEYLEKAEQICILHECYEYISEKHEYIGEYHSNSYGKHFYCDDDDEFEKLYKIEYLHVLFIDLISQSVKYLRFLIGFLCQCGGGDGLCMVYHNYEVNSDYNDFISDKLPDSLDVVNAYYDILPFVDKYIIANKTPCVKEIDPELFRNINDINIESILDEKTNQISEYWYQAYYRELMEQCKFIYWTHMETLLVDDAHNEKNINFYF
jgi:hypothetical protein